MTSPFKHHFVFEGFDLVILRTDPVWKSQVKEVWLWDEHPQRSEWGPDCGIDLVFNDQSGKTWAVQAKCFAPEGSIKKSDMDSFISAASDARFQGRVLVSLAALIRLSISDFLMLPSGAKHFA
jgi:predicted helicase